MGHISALNTFLDRHRGQLQISGVPEIYWKTLYQKLSAQTFDAGNSFQLVKIEYEENREPHEPVWALQALEDLDANCSDHIYLIDHAWTYEPREARTHLQYDGLRLRMANILGIDDNLPTEELIDEIFDNMWRANCTYNVRTVGNATAQKSIWYVMDEIGSAINHSNSPNCRVVPFIYTSEEIYSLLFLKSDFEEGDLAYRDYAEGIQDPISRKAYLLPWIPVSFQHLDVATTIPDEAYFTAGHIPETLPNIDYFKKASPKKAKYLCYSQYSLVNQYLTDPKFETTDDVDKADILWFTEHYKDYQLLSEASPDKFVNQFPYEYILTVKDLLCITCRRYKNNTGKAPWLPVSYNLVNEVGNFVSYFEKCEENGKENYWIIKPYNLARGMDIHITNNLNYIMRLPVTGPKIAQEYLINPVLFYREDCQGKVKFDVRYVILLKKVKPLEVYVYKNFFLRFANKPFALNAFDDYEKHFTVMNYNVNATLKHMKCDEFLTKWQEQYAKHEWNEIENKIYRMIRDIMECATAVPHPCGIAHSPQSRALYAVDLMLDWLDGEIQPKILEINFMPDCERACKYYENFYNDIFKLLFLDEENHHVFVKL
ncbi:tubulin--tyrosine ligase-like protein 12 [Dendroctonus ponderosae]|uniref:tubulin--tyrosine ligase-like protein 12 n=1 Tax=Dendroctonus ponderosae TaxID=77166 RepID=UPI002034B0DD|nr:tubulin--tyrosine ligase-like protein 12 [Dendroctonus ponderosae]KAH1015489.1 hypothetical protein HUJ05_013205 [Dendroctonus ponderosae]